MWILLAVVDWNEILKTLGTIVVSILGTYGVMKSRLGKSKGELTKVESDIREVEADREDSRTDKAFAEMKSVLALVNEEIKALKRKDEKRDKTEAELREDIATCRTDRATLAEQNRWMKRLLKKHGLISDDDEENYPRTKSDELVAQTGKEGDDGDHGRDRSGGRVRGSPADSRPDAPGGGTGGGGVRDATG